MHPDDANRIYNRWWRITHLPKIRTKSVGAPSRLILNPVQEDLAKKVDLWPYHLVLKARQQGVSTFFLLWHLDATMHTENCNTVILAHEREALTKLFQIVKFAYESFPDRIQLADGTFWVKPIPSKRRWKAGCCTGSRRRRGVGTSSAATLRPAVASNRSINRTRKREAPTTTWFRCGTAKRFSSALSSGANGRTPRCIT